MQGPFKNRKDAEHSLLFSFGSGEFCSAFTAATCRLPRAGGGSPPLFRQCTTERKPAKPLHGSLCQHPSSIDSFWTKIVFPRFCFSPAPCCFVCLRGGGGLFSLNTEDCLPCCCLYSLSAVWSRDGTLCHLVFCLFGPHGCLGGCHLVFFVSGGRHVTQHLFIY